MAIIKREKRTHGYVVISNDIFNHPGISWASKGLLGYLLSKPDSWELLVNDIWGNFPGGRDAVYKMINELRAAGYIESFTEREGNGRIGDRGYIVREAPIPVELGLIPEKPEKAQSPHSEYQEKAKKSLVTEIQDKAVLLDPEKPHQALQDVYKRKNIKNKYKKTAAITPVPSSEISGVAEAPQNLAAASFSESPKLSASDLTIGAELTACQLAVIKQRLATVALPKGYCLDRLVNEITLTLINPKAFSEAGQLFDKKLNTLLKRVRQNLWTAPPEIMTEARQQQEQQAIQENYERNRLIAAISHAERMLDYSKQASNPLMREPFLKDLERARAELADFDRSRVLPKAASVHQSTYATHH